MKKMFILVTIGVCIFAYSNLSAQAVYTGAAKPAGYSNHPSAPDSPMDKGICEYCAIPEGEPDIVNEGSDTVNGGCNDFPRRFLDINLNEVYCGRGNGYLVGGYDYRDTDWYRFVLTQSRTIYWSAYTNFNAYLFILNNDCDNMVTYAQGAVPSGVATTISASLSPGTYYLWIGPQNFGPYPGNTGDYMVKVAAHNTGDPSTWCNPALIPTLTQWGLIFFGFVMLAFGTVFILRWRGTAA